MERVLACDEENSTSVLDEGDGYQIIVAEHDEELLSTVENNIIVQGKLAMRTRLPGSHAIEPEAARETDEESEELFIKEVNDPVRMYLREIGAVSLLNKDQEVEIAKRIAESEQEIIKLILQVHPCLAFVLSFFNIRNSQGIETVEFCKSVPCEPVDQKP